jgi:predicted Zn-dependent protease
MTSQASESAGSKRLKRKLADSALIFESEVLNRLVAREPGNITYLAALGQAFSKLKKHDRGLAVDQKLVAAKPGDPTFRYNLACSMVLTGDLDGACGQLLRAIDLGYRDFDHLLQDDDLTSLRLDPRFGLVTDRISQLG